MDTRNQIKSYIVREGMTMADLVEKLADQYGWSASVPLKIGFPKSFYQQD